jgi:hypothetical protein
MVANAMAIARREIAATPAPRQLERGALWQEAMECDVRDIAAQRALHAELIAATRANLAVSNPKFLDGR